MAKNIPTKVSVAIDIRQVVVCALRNTVKGVRFRPRSHHKYMSVSVSVVLKLLRDAILSSRFFEETAIILCLNEKDLFAEKIEPVNITTAFPEYENLNFPESLP
jgi:hypothetical protein